MADLAGLEDSGPRLTLAKRLRQRIAETGPITVADYMQTCLYDPKSGYYATRPALGAEGDFITAPLVSQMFGELMAAWTAEVWRRLGSPAHMRLVEFGPGDGSMMADILRAASAWPAFRAAIDPVLIETSQPLRARQAERLDVRWAGDLKEVGDDAPAIVLANEVFDCLPIRQTVFTADGWRERRIGLDASGALAFVVGEPAADIDRLGRPGEIIERSPARAALAARLGEFVVQAGGAALIVDYATDGRGDTLQALRRHQKVSPLACPGAADLTARVDFASLLAAVAPAVPLGPVSQADFLRRLGLSERAATLVRANPSEADLIGRQVERLTASHQMGELFQVVSLSTPGLTPPGFA